MTGCPRPEELLGGRRDHVEHLATCRDCRELIDLLEVARRAATAPAAFARYAGGAECPDEFELAAFAEDASSPVVRAHLADCGHCSQDVMAAVLELAADESESTPVRPHPLRLLRSARVWVAAMLVLVLALPIALDRLSPAPLDVTGLARIEALDVRLPRGAAEDEAEARYREGLEAYTAGDWGTAELVFREAFRADASRADVALYLGSTLLLLDRPLEAGPPLLLAGRGAEGAQADEARWQRAQAHLAAGDALAARDALSELAAGTGHRSQDAREQLAGLQR